MVSDHHPQRHPPQHLKRDGDGTKAWCNATLREVRTKLDPVGAGRLGYQSALEVADADSSHLTAT